MHGLADTRLARTLGARHAAPGEAWNLVRLAAAAGLSRSRFAETFRASVGQTLAQELANWRLVIVHRALRAGTPLKALAPDLGEASASARSRLVAQRQGGLSPRAGLQQRTG